MRRTTIGDLLVPFVIVGITVYALLRYSYDAIPPLSYFVPVPITVLAIAEYLLSRRVRAVVRHDPRAKPMAAIAVARAVALGKASALVGAAVGGAAVALLVRVAPHGGEVRLAASDTRVSALVLAAALALGVAGLLLERAGIDPGHGAHTTGVG